MRRFVPMRAKGRLSASASPAVPVPAALTMAELVEEGLRRRQQQGMEAAAPFFQRAAEIEPNSHVPRFMLGNVASESGDLDAAVFHYEQARTLRPTDHVIRYNLGLNLLWSGYIDAAIEELKAACSFDPGYLPTRSAYLMALHSSDRVTPEEIAAETRSWAAQFAMQHPEIGAARQLGAGLPLKPKVGFISGDFRAHSVAHFFEPIASARDREAFQYVFYSNSPETDSVTERLRAHADAWRDVWQLTDEDLLAVIRSDEIDILVDLSGHTVHNRLAVFARRAAAVQIAYLGYPDSTGLATMDFRIADAVTDPFPLADAWHSEKLLRLPDSQWCFRPFGPSQCVAPLPARSAGFVTFGSFNNLTKLNDATVRCWAHILVNTPSSRLRLTRIRSPRRAAEIVAVFARAGISAERIECVGYRSGIPYGLQFTGVDISLDPYPYGGVTTTCESLYMGVPVVSLRGRHGVSLSGLSIMGTMGLDKMVASSAEEYVAIAVSLAGDLDRLDQLRMSLRDRFDRSPLRDEKQFSVNFEECLRAAWHRKFACQ